MASRLTGTRGRGALLRPSVRPLNAKDRECFHDKLRNDGGYAPCYTHTTRDDRGDTRDHQSNGFASHPPFPVTRPMAHPHGAYHLHLHLHSSMAMSS